MGRCPVHLSGGAFKAALHIWLHRNGRLDDVPTVAAWHLHSGGRVKEQDKTPGLAIGVRATDLLCGNPRRLYLLLVHAGPGGNDSAVSSSLPGSSKGGPGGRS